MRLAASKAVAPFGHCANSPRDGKAGFSLLGAHLHALTPGLRVKAETMWTAKTW